MGAEAIKEPFVVPPQETAPHCTYITPSPVIHHSRRRVSLSLSFSLERNTPHS
jgi:hypothetical protein